MMNSSVDEQERRLEDIQADIVSYERYVSSHANLTDERALAVMNTLATALVERYQRLSNIADLDKASRLCRSVSALTKKNDINHFQSIANLVVILTLTFEQTSDVVHLKDAVTLSKKALDCASPDHYIKALNNFAGVTFHLVKQTGRTELLDEARQHLLNAKKRASSATIEPADVAATISTLSVIHKTAFELLGILDDLNEAIKLSQQSLDLRPSGSPSRDIALNNHATILIMRYEKTGDPEDLRQAIDTYERTLALRPEGHPNRSVSLANLAVAITSRFRAQGSADDMDGALELLYQSLELTPAPHSRRPYSLMNIAVLLVSRYHQFQEARDLDECVRLLDQMGELCGEGHSLRVAYLSNLGSALELQYRRSSDLIYLKRGIRCLRDALRVCGPRDINKPTLLQNLGRQLRTLFQKNTDINILQESTRVLEDALTFYSTEHPRRPLALRNLARNYAIQGFRTGDKDWAVRARDLLLEALSLRDVGYPDRAEVMLEIVDLQLKFRPPGFPRDCGNELLVHALKDDACSPQIRLRLVNELLQRFHPPSVLAFCNTRDSLQQLVDIFSLATHLLPEVAFLGLDSQARLTALVGTESLGLEAAGYALCLPDCARAVELLEQSRAIFWSQALKLRSPLDDLPKDLRAEITEVCQWLERDSLTWSRESEASEPLATLTHKAALRRRQSEKLSNLFLRARDIPGLERFMLHERFDSLARAASSGPIIILLANKVACSGIMIKPSGQAVHVPLPQVTIERLGQLRKDWRKGLCKPKKQQKQFDVLEELWRNVVKPIIDALEFKPKQHDRKLRPRVWWCPTADFIHLPIHAAGIHTNPANVCHSYMVSSYTPTIGALLAARRGFKGVEIGQLRILLGAVPEPYDLSEWDKLPSTGAEVLAVACVDALSSATFLQLPPEEDIFTKKKIAYKGISASTLLKTLPHADILHIACHGYQDSTNPLGSGLVLADKLVTVSDLMRLSLPRASVAFLCGCDTAKGDVNQPDQAVHLATTMLFVGFRSVVATLWSMQDDDGPILAQTFYEALLSTTGPTLTMDAVAYALDEAVHKLRDINMLPSTWAPFVHVGM